ncbi:MAG: hypothetical protein Q4G46_10145, partial [Propionibacteriaceae bacterium]|nr:hypothetical protein [Propionibacteriaceae bacterium]
GPSGRPGQEPMRFERDTLIWRKDLSPVVPVRVARALREAGAPRRLAVHWLMAMWVIALADDSELARVNELLGPPDPDTETSFVWLDELELDPDEY